MTHALLHNAPWLTIGVLLLYAAVLCGRLERWHTRRTAHIANHASRRNP